MLVLSRKLDESIVVSVDGRQLLELKVVEFKGDKVRLGFTAPADVVIHRAEVAEAIRKAGRS